MAALVLLTAAPAAGTSFPVVSTDPSLILILILTSTVADDATVNRGQVITFVVAATNTAPAGSAPATDVTVSLPVSDQLVIGAVTASPGSVPTVTPGSPQVVSVTFLNIAPGESATLTVPTTVQG